jgi:hypothetical protein
VPLTSLPVPASPLWKHLYRRVPALDSLRHYSPAILRADVLAGIMKRRFGMLLFPELFARPSDRHC